MWKSSLAALTTLTAFFGCAFAPIKVPINVYNVDNGDLLRAVFNWAGRRGTATATTGSGVSCDGEYFTESGATNASGTGWGSIYGRGVNAFSSASTSFTIQSGSERGTAILRCNDRNVVQCEYVVNTNNQGSGYCRDNRSNQYKFVF